MHPIKLLLLRLYTLETFLYGTLNRTCRFGDVSKIDTLGPYAKVLSDILKTGRYDSDNDRFSNMEVYRGSNMTE
jgi:hypothetical protein